MSIGIVICSQPDIDINGWFHHFATDFENINGLLKRDGCDLSPYLYCPESEMSEESARECGYSEENIAYMKIITSEDFYPLEEVTSKIKKAILLVRDYDEDKFEYGKEPFLDDLNEIDQSLAKVSNTEISIQFTRA